MLRSTGSALRLGSLMNSDRREQLGEMLSAFMDGELDSSQAAAVERLLREDAGAKRQLEELRQVAALVTALPRHGAPRSIAEDLRLVGERAELLGDAEQPVRTGPRKRLSAVRGFAIAAMLGLVVWGGWWLVSPEHGGWNWRRSESAVVVAPGPAGPPYGSVGAAPGDRIANSRIPSRRNDSGPAAKSVDAPLTEPRVEQAGLGVSGWSHGGTDPSHGIRFAQKCGAGEGPATLRAHPFSAEPVRLQVALANESERDSLTARLVDHLSKNKLVDVSVAGVDDTRPGRAALYQQGRAGVNFADAEQQQILVHAPVPVINSMIGELDRALVSKDNVTLLLGEVPFAGLARAQLVLAEFGTPSPPSAYESTSVATQDIAVGEAVPDNGPGFLEGLKRVLGLDGMVLGPGGASRPMRRSRQGENASQSVSARTEADGVTSAGGTRDALDRTALESSNESQTNSPFREVAGHDQKVATNRSTQLNPTEREPLVGRRLREIEEEAARGAKSEVNQHAPPNETTQDMSEGRAQGRADSGAESALPEETGSCITLVIEIQVAPGNSRRPASPTPSRPTKPAQEVPPAR